MKLRHGTPIQLAHLDFTIEALKTANKNVLIAECPELRKKIHSALKSAGGARRHMERRIRETRAEFDLPEQINPA